MKKYIYLVFIIPLFLTSCSKEDDDPEVNLLELPNINVVDISQESDWDYWVFSENDYYFIKVNSTSTLPEAVLYHSSEINKDFSIFLNEDGLVDKVVLDNHIFVFRNFNGNFVDLGVIYPNYEIEIFRELETPNYNWETLTFNKTSSSKDFTNELIRWTGHTIAGIPCALSVAAALPTGGVSLITTGITCGVFLARLTGDIAANDFNIENGLTADALLKYDIYGTVLDCAFNGLYTPSCISGILIDGYQLYNKHSEIIDDISSDVLRAVTGSLEYGYGDVQITLTWTNGADLDLHVIDPNGEEIWWDHKYSASNGKLDVDDIDGFGPENIFWPKLEAPTGIYKIYIHHYPWNNKPKSSNYTVLINAFGEIKKYSGSITEDQVIHIKDFDQTGLKSSLDKNTSTITTNLIKN
jgi:hypothetical protein